MRLHNFVNVIVVDVGIPHGFRVNHSYRAGGTAVQATSLVDADLARAGQTGFLDLALAAVKAVLRVMLGT